MLDVNEIAGDESYFSVAGVQVSSDHKILSYGVDTRGRRFYDLRFIDLETGEHLADSIDDVTPDHVWANDGKTIIYVRQDPDTLRSHRVTEERVGKGCHTQMKPHTLLAADPRENRHCSIS